MSNPHIPPRDLELYVLGTLESSRTFALEQHVVTCADCGKALEREARFEIAMPGIIATARRRPRNTGAAVRAAGFAVAAAAVAVFALGAARSGGPRMHRDEIGAGAASGNQGMEWGCADGGEGQRCGAPVGDVAGAVP